MEQRIADSFMHVFHRAHNLASALHGDIEIRGNTARNANTLEIVVVGVQSTMACRLISVEVTFEQESRSAMFKHA